VQEPLLRLESLVDPLELLDDPVEPLEKRVDLAVSQIPAVHGAIVRWGHVGARLASAASTVSEQSTRRTP
jgi:hypothetical protein